MKPAAFRYLRPTGVDEAVEALEADPDARVIAGGQSLVPLMNFRLATPSTLVDVASITDIDFIRTDGSHLCVGASARQRDVELSETARGGCRLLTEALAWVGHPQIRNRGTVCGSLAHADPGSELPAVALALDAEIVVHGPSGVRTLAPTEFFQAPFWTALEPGELVTEVRFPLDPPGSTVSVQEYARRSGDFALAGVAMRATTENGGIVDASMAAFGVGPTPVRLAAAEAAARAGADDAVLGEATRSDVPDPTSDNQAGGEYRSALLAELVRRAVEQCSPDGEVQGR